jgi:hypothetical protein
MLAAQFYAKETLTMPSPSLGTAFRRLLFFSVFLLFFASPVLAQTVWTVTISVTQTGTLAYQNAGSGDTCSTTYPVQPPTGPYLYVCPKDVVNWQVTQAPLPGGLKHSEMCIAHHDAILHDSNNKHRQGFHGADGTPDGGTIDTSAKGAHHYCIFVWDPDAQIPYVDDPKIMIGGRRGSGSKGHPHGQDKKSPSGK